MSTMRTLERWAAAAGLWLVCAAPAASLAQAPGASARPPRSHAVMVPDSKLKHADPMDDFAGVNFTDAQKARVEQIREKYRSRMHDVAAATRLAPDQRAAMLAGTQRLERGEVYQVLTTEQKAEVRKRIIARRQVELKQQERLAPPARSPRIQAPPAQPPPH